jgi:hypothetical protein
MQERPRRTLQPLLFVPKKPFLDLGADAPDGVIETVNKCSDTSIQVGRLAAMPIAARSPLTWVQNDDNRTLSTYVKSD